MSTKIVFFGSTDLSAACLLKILENTNYDVKAVVCQPDNPKAKKNKLYSRVKEIAIQNNILCLQPEKIINDLNTIRNLNSTLGVCVAYGQFLPKAIRDLFENGIINVHPSLLPKYRGAAPVQYAIWNNDIKTGITIMKITKEMDAGPFCFQNSFLIDPKWTSGDLMNEVVKQAPDILVEQLDLIINKNVKWIDQDETQKSFAFILTKEQEKINWNSPSKAIVQHIKAFSPIPGTFANFLDNQSIKFFDAELGNHLNNLAPGIINLIDKNFICVKANDDSCIHITEFLLPGKKRIKVSDYNGKFPFKEKDIFF